MLSVYLEIISAQVAPERAAGDDVSREEDRGASPGVAGTLSSLGDTQNCDLSPGQGKQPCEVFHESINQTQTHISKSSS